MHKNIIYENVYDLILNIVILRMALCETNLEANHTVPRFLGENNKPVIFERKTKLLGLIKLINLLARSP